MAANPTTISMSGAAWLLSLVRSFATKSEFVKYGMEGIAFSDKKPEVREKMFGDVYDLAVPKKSKKSVIAE